MLPAGQQRLSTLFSGLVRLQIDFCIQFYSPYSGESWTYWSKSRKERIRELRDWWIWCGGGWESWGWRKKRLLSSLISVNQCMKEECSADGSGLISAGLSVRTRGSGRQLEHGQFYPNIRKHFLLCKWQSTGIDCPEGLWRSSKATWTRSWASDCAWPLDKGCGHPESVSSLDFLWLWVSLVCRDHSIFSDSLLK